MQVVEFVPLLANLPPNAVMFIVITIGAIWLVTPELSDIIWSLRRPAQTKIERRRKSSR